MKCFNCSKISYLNINCPFCNNKYCSNSCLEFHKKASHPTNNNYIKTNIYEKPRISRKTIDKVPKALKFSSPYITSGFIEKNLIYDQKYDLINFIPIFKNNEQIIIGTGSYGKVFLYRNKIDNKLYAIKHMNKNLLNKTLKNLSGIKNEIYFQSRIFHQNIVRLLYVKESNEDLDLIMDYASKGSLFYYIREKDKLTEQESFKYFSQIINAVYFLHQNDLIHRDIKPENILLYENDICKLCDFGWCVKLDGEQRSTFCGTPEYMSPELVNKLEYTKEVDVWSLGILLYEMIHGYSPFRPENALNAKEVLNKIKIHDLKFNIDVSQECKDLISHLLDENKENRYKIEDIFNSSFFKKYENKNLYFPIQEIIPLKGISPGSKKLIKCKNVNEENKDRSNNIYYNKKLEIPKNNMNNINEVKSRQIINNEHNNNIGKYYNILTYNINDNNNNYYFNNIINEFDNNLNSSFEKKYNINTEIPLSTNNKLYNSPPFRIFKNVEVREISESENINKLNDNILNNNNVSSPNINIKSETPKKMKKVRIRKLPNNNQIKNYRPINIQLINNINILKGINPNISSDDIFYNDFHLNQRLNIDNFRKDKFSNDYEKRNIINKLKYMKRPKTIVKKLSSNNNIISINNIVNYNNYYLHNKRNRHYQYKNMTLFNNSYSSGNNSCPKDNLKAQLLLKNKTLQNNNINSNKNLNKTYIKENKVNEVINKINTMEYNKPPSLVNNINTNSLILKTENRNEIPRNMYYYLKDIPSLTKEENVKKNDYTYRPKSNIKSYKMNKNLFFNNNNSNNKKYQLNTNYIFNPKVTTQTPINTSFSSKSKKKIIFPYNNNINVGKSHDNLQVLKNLNKAQSSQKINFKSFINKNYENNLNVIKNNQCNLNNEKNISAILNKNNFTRVKSGIFYKKGNNLNNNNEPNLINKKYFKMNDISNINNINNNNNLKNNNKNLKEGLQYIKNERNQNYEKPIKIYNEKNNYSTDKKPEKKTNKKIMKLINQHFNKIKKKEDSIKSISKDKKNEKSLLSEKVIDNNNNSIDIDNYTNTYSGKKFNLIQTEISEERDKTPKKEEDRKKIIPTELLNKFSLEFKHFKKQ